jgi:hypothetical protein
MSRSFSSKFIGDVPDVVMVLWVPYSNKRPHVVSGHGPTLAWVTFRRDNNPHPSTAMIYRIAGRNYYIGSDLGPDAHGRCGAQVGVDNRFDQSAYKNYGHGGGGQGKARALRASPREGPSFCAGLGRRGKTIFFFFFSLLGAPMGTDRLCATG